MNTHLNFYELRVEFKPGDFLVYDFRINELVQIPAGLTIPYRMFFFTEYRDDFKKNVHSIVCQRHDIHRKKFRLVETEIRPNDPGYLDIYNWFYLARRQQQ